MKIVISSGHWVGADGGTNGAHGLIDEVVEARKVVEAVAQYLRDLRGFEVTTFHDDESSNQDENLDRIVDFHNAQERDLDVSVHFNACDPPTDDPRGTECYYQTQTELAALV